MGVFAKNVLKKLAIAISFLFIGISSTWSFVKTNISSKYSSQSSTDQIDPALLEFAVGDEFKEFYKDILPLQINKKQEVINMRSEYSKTYYLGHNKFRLVSGMVPLHYKTAQGTWGEISYDIVNHRVDKGSYIAELYHDDYGYSLKHKKDAGGFKFRLKSIGGVIPDYKAPEIAGSEARWKDIVPGVDLVISFQDGMVGFWRTLHHKDAPREIVWEVEEEPGMENMKLIDPIIGYDNQNRLTHNTREKINEKKDRLKTTYELIENFTGSVIEIAKDTRRKELNANTQYPVIIDGTVDVNTDTCDNCDAIAVSYHTAGSGGYKNIQKKASASFKIFHNTTGGGYIFKGVAYFLFQGVTIPKRSTITDADIRLRMVAANTGAGQLVIQGFRLKDVDPATWPPGASTTAKCAKVTAPTNPGLLTPTGNHSFPGTQGADYYQTIALENVIQNLVNTFDYNGDEMLLRGKQKLNDPEVKIKAEPTDTGFTPKLTVTYTELTPKPPLKNAVIIVQ